MGSTQWPSASHAVTVGVPNASLLARTQKQHIFYRLFVSDGHWHPDRSVNLNGMRLNEHRNSSLHTKAAEGRFRTYLNRFDLRTDPPVRVKVQFRFEELGNCVGSGSELWLRSEPDLNLEPTEGI